MNPAVLDLAQSVLPGEELRLKPVTGGANNRIFHATGSSGEIIIKVYHHGTDDHRDRFAAEQRFYSLGLPRTPEPFAWDTENRLGAFRVIHGKKLTADEVTTEDVSQCIEWVCGIQKKRQQHEAAQVTEAADACFSIKNHIDLIERRVNRLVNAGEDHQEFRTFVSEILAPSVRELTDRTRQGADVMLDEPLPFQHRVLSPSDFGFHDALKDDARHLCFFDFEYAGWDDLAKLLCDFFCQPQVPVSIDCSEVFVKAIQQVTEDDSLPERFRMLLPIHAAKWACILLNEFLKSDAHRRRFARQPINLEKQLYFSLIEKQLFE